VALRSPKEKGETKRGAPHPEPTAVRTKTRGDFSETSLVARRTSLGERGTSLVFEDPSLEREDDDERSFDEDRGLEAHVRRRNQTLLVPEDERRVAKNPSHSF
jgi:hypothetical protein